MCCFGVPFIQRALESAESAEWPPTARPVNCPCMFVVALIFASFSLLTLPKGQHCVARHSARTEPARALRATLGSMSKNVFSTLAILEATRYRRRVSALAFACGGALISILNAASQRAGSSLQTYYPSPISIPLSETCCGSLHIHYQGDMFSTLETSIRPLPPRVRPLSRHAARRTRRAAPGVYFFFFPGCPGRGGRRLQPLQTIGVV